MPDDDQQRREQLREVLASPAYLAAFDAVMRGTDPALLTDEQREAARRARELAGVHGPGYPAPLPVDPNRPEVRGA